MLLERHNNQLTFTPQLINYQASTCQCPFTLFLHVPSSSPCLSLSLQKSPLPTLNDVFVFVMRFLNTSLLSIFQSNFGVRPSEFVSTEKVITRTERNRSAAAAAVHFEVQKNKKNNNHFNRHRHGIATPSSKVSLE